MLDWEDHFMISIIVPVYNTEKYLHRCVDSILNQTFTDFELILVDDGSTDRSGEICDEYAKNDKRINVIHKSNGGLSDARNAGLDIAKGEYISFIDGDDYIHPQTYEIILKIMSETRSDLGCFNYRFIQPDENAEFERYDADSIEKTVVTSDELLNNFNEYYHAVSWISACTKIYHKNAFNNNRYPYGKVDEDSYMLHHVIGDSKRVVRIEEKLYYYVWTQGSISRSAFSPKRFDKNGANLDRVEFFKIRGIKRQEDFFKREYLLNILKMYYFVKNEHPELLKDYKPYISEYKAHASDFMKGNTRICNMERLIYNAFLISPKLTEKLYDKYLA